MLKDASQIYVGRRGKYSQHLPDENSREEIMSLVMGRSGNLRAPTLRVGDAILVGFSKEMYESIF